MADEIHGAPLVSAAPDAVNLTDDTSAEPKDHMSTIAAMVREESRQTSNLNHRSRKKASSPSNIVDPSLQTSVLERHPNPSTSINDTDGNSSSPPPQAPTEVVELSDSDDVHIVGVKSKRPAKTKKYSVFHRFLDLPPEIRNRIYALLLTTPGIPIEFPKLTGPEGRRRDAAWAGCTTSQARRAHKTIFHEILSTSRQTHHDALPFLYSCNIFKYRCSLLALSFGPGVHPAHPNSQSITLPTRHLSLLKHIKIAVILSRMANPYRVTEGEDFEVKWPKVVGLIENFAMPELELETFELSFYSFYPLTLHPTHTATPLHDALLKVRASRSYRLLVLGEAKVSPEFKAAVEAGVGKGTKVEVKGEVDWGVERAGGGGV